jgi:uncharacterized protein (DUF488 family)
MVQPTIYTIGHSNVSGEAFVALLRGHAISAVADVRSQPYSRWLPHFSQGPLKAVLGRELGARPDDPGCYEGGRAVYARIAATPRFAEGLERLRRGAARERIALLCAEKDPITCHRTILVCRHLRGAATIAHILADGGLESHGALERRLLELHGLHQLNFLNPKSPAELLEEAYDRQGEQIAYQVAEEGGDG